MVLVVVMVMVLLYPKHKPHRSWWKPKKRTHAAAGREFPPLLAAQYERPTAPPVSGH